MNDFIQYFHFLRPWWLLLFIPVLAIVMHYRYVEQQRQKPFNLIAPHLLKHLLVNHRQQPTLQPFYFLVLFWLIGIIALAGPGWKKIRTPFDRDDSKLVIVIKVGPSMLASDIQPSRLQRARQKIQDLLEQHPGRRTALIAYRGSSHLVVPFTTDPRIINMFSKALSPAIMPVKGDNPLVALQQAAALIEKDGQAGDILLVTDALPATRIQAFKQFSSQHRIPLQIYAIAAPADVPVPADSPPAPALDYQQLQQAARALSARLVTITPDHTDIHRLTTAIKSGLRTASQSQPGQRWQDNGYWLLLFLLFPALSFFRRGWVINRD